MPMTLNPVLCRDSLRAEVEGEINASQILTTRVTRSDSVLIIRYEAFPVGDFWDVCYGSRLSGADRAVLEELMAELVKRTGRPVQDLVVEHQSNPWSNPNFPGSPSHTYIRLSIRMVTA
ncbi:hypothetical protein [Kitasatospora cineracea]|uniref:hypothetical protein n=1 Tax=Kitasatospora cineracea TaxID=88074 RepID=UPI003805A734